MITKSSSLCAAIATTAFFLLPTTSVNAQNESWDTSYIADDTFFVIGINVKSLMELEPEDSMLRASLVKMVGDESGIKLEQLRQIQFVMGGMEIESDEDTFEIKMMFTEDQDFDPLVEKMFRGKQHEEAEHDGKKYLQSDTTSMPSYYMPDEKTIILANEVRLKTVMENERSMGEIADRIQKLDGEADVIVAFSDDEQLNKNVGKMLRRVGPIGDSVTKTLGGIEQGTISIKIDSGDSINAVLVGKDEEAAEEVETTVNTLINLGKVGLDSAKGMVDEQFGEMKSARDSAKKGIDTAESLLDSATVVRQNETVTVNSKVMGGITDGVRALTNLMIFGVAG